jgi:pyrroloquinoline quinone biosynthesis protein B
VPQWNCGCANCAAARHGGGDVLPRREECVAVSRDGESWFLLNAPPEIRACLASFEPLWPAATAGRANPLAGILLGNGDLDHCLGLFCLRESQALSVHATATVWSGLAERNAIFRTLQRFEGQVTWRPLRLGQPAPLLAADGSDSGLDVTALPLPGKRPLHLEALVAPSPEDNVGLRIADRARGTALAYASSVAGPSPELDTLVAGAAAVFFDGTFFSDDELAAAGLGTRTAAEMAHWPVGGASGSARYLAALTPAPARRVLIHINNTNPILREGDPARRSLAAAGIEVAHDGMELAL